MELSLEVLAQDLPRLLNLLSGTSSRVSEVREHVAKLREHLDARGHDPGSGISLLELKFQLLLSYLINMVQLMLLKTAGQYSSSAQPLHRLVEIRTVLEKIRPLDQKLKYQVDKLIRTASTGLASAGDPLRFKPNPSNLVPKLEESVSSEEDNGSSSDHKLYVPPKVVSAPYEESSRKSRAKRGQGAALVKELKEEVLDTPTELKTTVAIGGLQKRKEVAKEKEIEQFEESNMMRLSRKRKANDTGRSNRQEMDDLTDFSELRSLTQELGNSSIRMKAKRKTSIKKRFKRRK